MTSQAAYAVEKAIGHDTEFIKQDVANYKGKGEGEPSETMKALTWQGKQKVQVRMLACISKNVVVLHELTQPAFPVDVPKPKIIEDSDVILKVTGTTVCGSDLHLLHGTARFGVWTTSWKGADALQAPSCR